MSDPSAALVLSTITGIEDQPREARIWSSPWNSSSRGLQQITATQLNLNPVLITVANSAGGNFDKMVSAQSICVAAAATDQVREGGGHLQVRPLAQRGTGVDRRRDRAASGLCAVLPGNGAAAAGRTVTGAPRRRSNSRKALPVKEAGEMVCQFGSGGRRVRLLVAVALVSFAVPCLAKYANVWEPVPLPRLIGNLEAKIKANPKDAEATYILGRLHGLGFIRGETPVAFAKDSEVRAPFPPYERIREPRAAGTQPSKVAFGHLQQSIRLYTKAADLEPRQGLYQLGLGWMLLQGADHAKRVDWPLGKTGEKRTRNQWLREAAKSLRKAFDLTQKADLAQESAWIGQDWSISLESAESLLKLYEKEFAADLDASAQRKRLKTTIEALNKKSRVITPIVFPLDRKSSLASVIDTSKQVRFDLAGDNHAERWPWLTPSAALLVWDPLRTGKITSGRQLFGSRTWQMFWRHGYQPLAALDDDRSGSLTGKELNGIAAWVDRNGNGVSEPGEVVPVSKLGIVGIAVRPALEEGLWHHPEGLHYSEGGTGPTYDWTPTSVGR